MPADPVYRISFVNQGNVYEIYASHVYPSDMFGFLCVESLLFGETSGVLVDPSEEKLKNEFNQVEKTHIPVHAVIRVDEVAKEGTAKIRDLGKDGGSVTPFPGSIFTPGMQPDISNKE